jgi:hypothetical protein
MDELVKLMNWLTINQKKTFRAQIWFFLGVSMEKKIFNLNPLIWNYLTQKKTTVLVVGFLTNRQFFCLSQNLVTSYLSSNKKKLKISKIKFSTKIKFCKNLRTNNLIDKKDEGLEWIFDRNFQSTTYITCFVILVLFLSIQPSLTKQHAIGL